MDNFQFMLLAMKSVEASKRCSQLRTTEMGQEVNSELWQANLLTSAIWGHLHQSHMIPSLRICEFVGERGLHRKSLLIRPQLLQCIGKSVCEQMELLSSTPLKSITLGQDFDWVLPKFAHCVRRFFSRVKPIEHFISTVRPMADLFQVVKVSPLWSLIEDLVLIWWMQEPDDPAGAIYFETISWICPAVVSDRNGGNCATVLLRIGARW
jgi:hypothetical protein